MSSKQLFFQQLAEPYSSIVTVEALAAGLLHLDGKSARTMGKMNTG
jgi:hypothetical protein